MNSKIKEILLYLVNIVIRYKNQFESKLIISFLRHLFLTH